MKRTKVIKVLVAKPGLDGHDRGAKVLALGLRDHGFEVIYTGLRQTPERIVHTALQEDVDVIGMSCLSGAHTYHFPKVAELLKEQGVTDILVIGGGIIPEKDVPGLIEKGIAGIFGPGTPIPDIVDFINKNVKRDKSIRSREA
jgi:methylmalonyl-CoA mutase, C-terminal domain